MGFPQYAILAMMSLGIAARLVRGIPLSRWPYALVAGEAVGSASYVYLLYAGGFFHG